MGRHGLEVAAGLGLERRADPLGELVEREAAIDHVLAQDGHGAVPIDVGDPFGRRARWPRAWTVLGKGCTAVCHEVKSAPNRGAGADPQFRQPTRPAKGV